MVKSESSALELAAIRHISFSMRNVPMKADAKRFSPAPPPTSTKGEIRTLIYVWNAHIVKSRPRRNTKRSP